MTEGRGEPEAPWSRGVGRAPNREPGAGSSLDAPQGGLHLLVPADTVCPADPPCSETSTTRPRRAPREPCTPGWRAPCRRSPTPRVSLRARGLGAATPTGRCSTSGPGIRSVSLSGVPAPPQGPGRGWLGVRHLPCAASDGCARASRGAWFLTARE